MDTENGNMSVLSSPKASATAPMTPRRSARKSVMPQLDYNDIIEKKMFRSETKKTKESELVRNISSPHKWTPSEVGRVSQSRRRKSRRIMAKSSGTSLQELRVEQESETYSKDTFVEAEENEKETVELHEKRVERSSKGHIVDEIEPTKDENNHEKNGLAVDLQTDKSENFGAYLKSNAMDISDLGLEPLQTDENNDEMPSLLLCDDEDDTKKCNVWFGKSVGTSSEHIVALKNSFTEDVQRETKEKNDVMPSILIDDNHDVTCSKNLEGTSRGHIVGETEQKNDFTEDLQFATEEKNDEMPSILIGDDEDETEKSNVICPKTEVLSAKKEQENINEILNSTFETEESTVLLKYRDTKSLTIEKERQKDHTQNEEPTSTNNEDIVMQSLQISDDEDVNDEKCPVLGSLNSRNNENCLGLKHESGFKFVLTDDTQQKTTLFHCELPQPGTPKATHVKPYRQPTPYKPKLRVDIMEKTKNVEKSILARSQTGLNITTLEPRDIALRSIRKRSNSFSINPQNARGVTFYSPANQILGIEDVDKLMAKSAKKFVMSTKDTLDRNVTKRRKRSISLDDTKYEMSRIPKPLAMSIAPLTKINNILPKGVSPASKQKCRSKLPNFAAIHQKHFSEMENLVQHLERRAERAKVLTNSNIKARQASAQKKEANKPVKSTASKTPNKKLELLFQVGPNTHLPKPRQIFDKQISDIKYSQNKNTQQPMKELHAAAPAASRPPFTLSTHVTSSVMSSNTTRYADKIAERRQRHMDMFKGRTTTKRGDSQRAEIIRGVRSNRRFQLQMQHRKNLEER